MRGATASDRVPCARLYFNPRSSCEERQAATSTDLSSLRNFNPRSSCEERHCVGTTRRAIRHFNPRSSCEERLHADNTAVYQLTFQSTLLMRGATRVEKRLDDTARISIHAPHARSDDTDKITRTTVNDFNPRSSCEERRCHAVCMSFLSCISIHAPHARSDHAPGKPWALVYRISIHAPHARSDLRHRADDVAADISIHAPHARSDLVEHLEVMVSRISIHAPHARSDWRAIPRAGHRDTISIHAPHARSDGTWKACYNKPDRFQSTLLMRGATSSIMCRLLRGSNFNPRSSCEERPEQWLVWCNLNAISIHAPHARSDGSGPRIASPLRAFQSTLLMRGATGAGVR